MSLTARLDSSLIVVMSSLLSANDAPTYTKPTLVLDTKPSISDLSITASAPTVPVLNPEAITNSNITEATFNTPVLTTPNWSDTENWITTEEDNEMVSSRLSVIGAQINDFNTKRGDQDRLYKWYKDQYTLLKQDYAMGLRMFTRGSLEQGEQQGARG